MGDLGGAGRPPGTKPRRLGQVKTESLQFQTAATATVSAVSAVAGGLPTRPSLYLPSYPELRRGPTGEEGVLRASIRSMREIRENLRQAALLNIVAANNDKAPAYPHHHFHTEGSQPPPLPAHDLRLHFFGTSPSQLAPPHHPHHHHPSNPMALQVASGGAFTQQQSSTAGGGAANCGTYHHSVKFGEGGDTSPLSSLPQNLMANLLSPRMKTISLPRPGPRVTDLSGPFIHKSLTQAKEYLSRVGEMVRSKTEGVEEMNDFSGEKLVETVTSDLVPFSTGVQAAVLNKNHSYQRTTEDAASYQKSTVVPVQGEALETSLTSADNGEDWVRALSASPSKAGGSAHSPDASIINTTSTATLPHPHSASNSSRMPADAGGHSAGSRKASGKQGEHRTPTTSAHHCSSLSVRRHLSPSKKRELVKRLTEMAKCEAVDMSSPIGMKENHSRDSRFMPPMIILSQQRQEIRCPEDSSSPPLLSYLPTSGLGDGEPGKEIHRAKSLSSINHPHQTFPAYSRDSLSNQEGHHSEKIGRLLRTPSGSMPDLVTEGGPQCSASQQQGMKSADNSDWAAASSSSPKHTFTEGIVGKTLLKNKEAGGSRGLVESRPLLLSKYRARRSTTRPSSRFSMFGLRDRAPLDTPSIPTSASTATTTSIYNLRPSSQNRLRSNPGSSQSSEPPPSSSQNLPVITITGLNRERPPPGTPAANSCVARELRPTSRAGVTGSLQFYQQLDDQCEKLQRQLNITLNMPPRRGPQWQSGTIPPPSMTLSRSSLSASHHQFTAVVGGGGPGHPEAFPASHFGFPNMRGEMGVDAGLSDVDEQSHVETTRTHTTTHHPYTPGEDLLNGISDRTCHHSNGDDSTRSNRREGTSDHQSEAMDPVFKSKKEPRYQGFSSRVPESEVRSQFHYITPGSVAESEQEAADAEEERKMKYQVLKALDQDVYYDFQHRKYRTTPGSTPLVRCNNEQDPPRIHFYKVKLNGET